MINILYLHAGAEMYGADKILLELISRLDKKTYNPLVILPTDGILRKKLQENGISTYVIPYPILRRKYFNLRGIFNYLFNYKRESDRIIKFLKRKNFKVDLIHVNTIAVLEGIYLKRKLNSKLLWHIHEIIEKPKIVSKILDFLVGKYADKCVVVSNAVKEHLLHSVFLKENKIKVIYNGVDLKKFNPNVDYDYLFKDFKIPKDSFRIGVIGRINAWKGQNDFLDATIPLLDDFPKLYLFIIGSAFFGQEWRIKELKSRIKMEKNSSHIIYSPYRSDNTVVQNFLDLLILPSTNPDPLPTVVLEAMACGKPVIGYAHGGVTEMVKSGYNGFLVEPLNKKELMEKIRGIITNSDVLKKMGNNSEKRIKEKFSLLFFNRNFDEVYKSLVKVESVI